MGTYNGTSGNDSLVGSGGNDTLRGYAGNDTLDGGAGADSMEGGQGNDRFRVDNAGDLVIELANEGTDWVDAAISFSIATLTNVENILLTGTGDIDATGNVLNNSLWGNEGNNVLDGGAGVDTMLGGDGDDIYFVDNTGDIAFDSDGHDIVHSTASYTLGSGIESLVLGGTGNHYGVGNELDNLILGNSGSNILNGEEGADTLSGQGGDDLYIVDNVGDVVTEGVGKGNDTISSAVSFNLNDAGNVEHLYLQGSGNTYGTGNALNNSIVGNSGGNILDGQGGDDTLSGGSGADLYLAGGTFGADTIVETTSTTDIDKLFFQDATYNELWFKQVGGDLEISQVGTSNKVTVQNWFAGTANQIDVTHDAGVAHQLQANKVQGLVTAMAGFSPQNLSGNATLIAARDAAWTV